MFWPYIFRFRKAEYAISSVLSICLYLSNLFLGEMCAGILRNPFDMYVALLVLFPKRFLADEHEKTIYFLRGKLCRYGIIPATQGAILFGGNFLRKKVPLRKMKVWKKHLSGDSNQRAELSLG